MNPILHQIDTFVFKTIYICSTDFFLSLLVIHKNENLFLMFEQLNHHKNNRLCRETGNWTNVTQVTRQE